MAKPAFNHSFNVGLIITLCLAAYFPGLTNFMFVDDVPNIVQNGGIKISQLDYDNIKSAAKSNDSGPIGRPIASLSFALNYYFSGQEIVPSHFKATNLGIHIANSILIYVLTLMLLATISKRTNILPAKNNLALALLITLLWALHPIQLTAILYSVQRMTSMASFFMLAGLTTYLIGRNRLEASRSHALTLMYGGIITGTTLGVLCKEIALLLPFYAMAIELTLYNRKSYVAAIKKNLKFFYLTIAVIPAIIAIFYLASHPQLVLGGYTPRDFTLVERLLTECRVLFYYVGLIIYPNLDQLTLHHDDIPISHGLLIPPTTLFALLGLVFLLVTALILRKRYAIFSFMAIWFLVGHAMESTIFGLEIAYEHRNYLPSYSIVFGTVFFSYLLIQHITKKKLLKITIAIVACTSLLLTTFTRASIWSEKGTIAFFDQKNHPNSARSQMTYAEYLLNINKPLPQAYEHVRIAASLTAAEVSPAIHLYKLLRIIEKDIDSYSDEHVEHVTTPTSYDAPLVINNDYIETLAVLINQEISNRLRGKIAIHRAAIALRELSYCILRGNPECTPLTQDTINWLIISTSNTRQSDKSSAVFYYFLAKLKAYTGDINSAFYYIDMALIAQPDDFSLLIDKVNLYLTIEDTEHAADLIQKLEQRNDMPENFKSGLNNSKEYLVTLQDNDRLENTTP